MDTSESNQNIKVTDGLAVEDSHPHKTKSFRYITAKWLGTSNKDDRKNNIKNSKEDLQKVENIPDGNVVADNKQLNENKKSEDESFRNSSTILLNVDNDLDLNLMSTATTSKAETFLSLEKQESKKKKALNTIKYYLDQNKSQEISDESNTTSNFKNTENNNSLYVNPFTTFEDYNDLNASTIDFDYSINSNDTNIEKPKTLFDIFSDENQTQKIDNNSNESLIVSDSDISSNVITISKAKTAQSTKDLTLNVLKAKTLNFNNQVKMVSLFVGDLNVAVTENDLYLYFAKYQGLISVKIPIDPIKNVSLKYGYVNFDTQLHADLATEGLNYTNLNGSEIRIMPSVRDKVQRENLGTNLFFSNLSSELTSRIMYDRFKAFGKLLSCKYNAEKRFCFISYSEKLNAYKICKQFNQTEMDGRIIGVSVHISKKDRENFHNTQKIIELMDNQTTDKFDKSEELHKDKEILKSYEEPISTKYSIFIKNLPMDLNDNVIRNLIEPYGTVKGILTRKVPAKNGAWALVTMTNQPAVEKAIQNLNYVEIEGKQLSVAKAIPREEKEYAKNEMNQPEKKLKLLISDINLEKDGESLKEWCSNCESIKSAEFFSNSTKGEIPMSKKSSGYGYIELNYDDDADNLIKKFNEFGISCYKIKVEIPDYENNSEYNRYPYFTNHSVVHNRGYFKNKSNSVSFSYVDPSKLLQIADFQKKVNLDKLNCFQQLKNHNKTRLKQRNHIDELALEIFQTKQTEMYHLMWEICARLLVPRPARNNNALRYSVHNEILSKSKVSSLTDHLVKFFWNNNFDKFYEFVKENQFDDKEKIIYVANPILANQILQSATYLGIIPKESKF
jgi:RNA recognition motif-containing protein